MSMAVRPTPSCLARQAYSKHTQDVEPIRVVVSACLLGQNVRWDGGHKKDAFLVGMLGRYVQTAYSIRTARELAARDLCGLVLKKDSPNCGLERVRVYSEAGGPAARNGRGLRGGARPPDASPAHGGRRALAGREAARELRRASPSSTSSPTRAS